MVFFKSMGHLTHRIFQCSQGTFHCFHLSGNHIRIPLLPERCRNSSRLVAVRSFRCLPRLYCQDDLFILPSAADSEGKADRPVSFLRKQCQKLRNMLIGDVFLPGGKSFYLFIQKSFTDHRMQRQKRFHRDMHLLCLTAHIRLQRTARSLYAPYASVHCLRRLQLQIFLRLRQHLRCLVHVRHTAPRNVLLRIG